VTSLVAGPPQPTPLVVRSVPISDPGPLVRLLPKDDPVAWVRRGEGLVGWGEAARIETNGPHRFATADEWWKKLSTSAVVRDEVDVPGSGLVAFGSFGFADDPGDSVLVVPEVVVGRRRDRWWVTTVGSALSAPPVPEPTDAPSTPQVAFSDGALSGAEWESVVADAVRRIEDGELHKVVLARDLVAEADSAIDVRWPLGRLVEHYPTCWSFHVGGLFGATPEMLVRRERGLVTSRVLAGTIRRTGDDEHDLALAGKLARSSKDLEEHEYAVRSVADALAAHCTGMNLPESPFVLHLPNVMHLATDVTGVVSDSTTALGLAAALHPSAAVGGTPTESAVALIDEIEGMDRGRYAGPVGWIDARGDGEWGIALRSGEVSGSRVRLFAGCGIVAGSDPEAELAESQAKFVPVRDALQS
jgi:menaquinone-specific isochorismate synthase